MPVLHIQFKARRPAAHGAVDIPPTLALSQRGPCIQIQLGLPEALAASLSQSGQAIPQPVSGLALVDTGASSTCIDSSAAQKLGLPVVDVVKVSSASHAGTDQPVHPVTIEAIGFPLKIEAPRAIAAPLAPQGLIALIGRDVLSHMTLHYNGLAGEITLAL